MAEPPITLRAVHDSGPGNLPITRIVIHATCPDVGYSAASAPNAAHGTALYFQNPAAGGSAHYVCGVDREEHCVPETVIAWHAPPNPHSLGIEITAEGGDYPRNYSREQWLSDEVWPAVERAAVRCRDLCDRHGVPKMKLTPADLLAGKHGICGHVDVSQAWHQTDHTDPNNSTFPWDRFMAVVNGEEDDMPLSADDLSKIQAAVWGAKLDSPGVVGKTGKPQPATLVVGEMFSNSRDQGAALATLLARDPTTVTAADIAAAIPADIAQQVADELAKRLEA